MNSNSNIRIVKKICNQNESGIDIGKYQSFSKREISIIASKMLGLQRQRYIMSCDTFDFVGFSVDSQMDTSGDRI